MKKNCVLFGTVVAVSAAVAFVVSRFVTDSTVEDLILGRDEFLDFDDEDDDYPEDEKDPYWNDHGKESDL